jgi:hypothetical protein
MATAADLRRILAPLPAVEERLTWDTSTFRVRGRIFAMIHPSDQKATVKATRSEQAALITTDPLTFAPAPYTGRFGWVTVRLASVDIDDLHDLIVDAWRQTAPKRLVVSLQAQKGSSEE